MPTAICFIDKMRKQRPIEPGSKEYQSGGWVVAEDKAKSLVGARIYFHEKPAGQSYYGGVITATRSLPQADAEAPVLCVFTFIPDKEGVGFLAGSIGWRKEQKTIP